MKFSHTVLTASAAFLLLGSAHAAQLDVVGAKIERLYVSEDDTNGGCMVLLDRDISTSANGGALDCNTPSGASDRWVTFACNNPGGEVWPSKSSAQTQFDMAQLAYAMNLRIRIKIDDARKIDGHCYGTAIQAYQ